MNEALIVIPFSRHEKVYPWGPHFVREYTQRHVVGAQVGLVDLSSAAPIRDTLAWERYPGLARVVASLRPRMPPGASKDDLPTGPFYLPPDGTDHAYVAGLLLLADLDFLHELCALAGEHALFDDVVREHHAFATAFREALRAEVAPALRDERPLFGISQIGRTLPASLSVAWSLRQLYPHATIVLGGPQITPDLAQAVASEATGIDAVVVGFGEKPFAALLEEVRARGRVDGLAFPFVVTRSSANVPGVTAAHEYRFDAKAGPFADPDLDSARVDDANVLHILPIRGCRWGACTFCADAFALKRFRAPVIETPEAKLEADIERAVDKWAQSGQKLGRLCIDAAEVYGDEAVKILSIVDRQLEARNVRFPDGVLVFFYVPARKFSLEMARQFRAFSSTTWQRFVIEPTIAVESLNQVSLQRIRKGIEPLQAIASLKTAVDLGWQGISAQYFVFYPGEEAQAVRDEVSLLKRSLHILASENVYLNLLHYPIVLREGELYNKPAEYGLICKPTPDPLLSLRLRREVVSGGTTFASQYRLDDQDPKNRTAAPWFELIAAYWWAKYRIEAARAPGAGVLRRLAVRALGGGHLAHKALRFFAASLVGERALLERALIAWWCNRQGNRQHWHSKKKVHRHPIFQIKNRRLERDYSMVFGRQESLPLSDDELRLLRALYFPKKKPLLAAELAWPPAQLDALVERHLGLGTLAQEGDLLVCLAADPEHLEPEAAAVVEPPVAGGPPLVTLRRPAAQERR